jgi:peptidyl-prolyl cis-trans isomerase C
VREDVRFVRVTRCLHVCMVCAAALLCCTTSAGAGEVKVASFDIVLSRRAALPVVRGVMQTQAGDVWNATALSGDLYRLSLLSYSVAQFEAQFTDEGAKLSLTASHGGTAEAPRLAAIELTGGVDAMERPCRAALRQRPSTLTHTRRLDYYGALKDIERIEQVYKAHGRLDARVRAVSIRIDARDRTARLRFTIAPGPAYALGAVTVKGNKKLDAGKLVAALRLGKSVPWTDGLRLEIIRRAVRWCSEQGYVDAQVGAQTTPGNGVVDVQIEMTEGLRCHVERVLIRDAGKHKDAVAKLINIRKGQPVKYSEIEALQHRIEDLGLFREVEMLFLDQPGRAAGHRDLVIRVAPVEPGRQIDEAEQLYYQAAQKLIALYNQGDAGVRSLSVKGFFTYEGKRVAVEGQLERPDYLRVKFGLGNTALQLVRAGKTLRVYVSALGRWVIVPDVAPVLRVLVTPSERAMPADVNIAPGLVKDAKADALLLGVRCNPAAAYFTRQALAFARKAPRLAKKPNTLVLPGDDGETTVVLNAEKLPTQITLRDAKGTVTAQFDIRVNPKIDRTGLPADRKPSAVDLALAAPFLRALGQGESATALAERAAAMAPPTAEAFAARGMLRVADGPPEPGLADLRRAVTLSKHPAYALLLAETLIAGRRYTEARAVCRDLLKRGPAAQKTLAPADLMLAVRLSIRAAADALTSGPPDHARRALTDAALANIGLKDYASAAKHVRALLKGDKGDPQATELLARCELSLGNAQAVLDLRAGMPAAKRRATLDFYAALAAQMLKKDSDAAAALAGAIGKQPSFRNLLALQRRAEGINAAFKPPAAKVALAKLFSRATMGKIGPDQKAKLAAIVNDAFVLRSDVKALARDMAAGRPEPDKAELFRRARNKIIEDMLIIRWAMWRGITADHAETYRRMKDEMRRLGADNFAEYARKLKAAGSSVPARRKQIVENLLKRQAFSTVLADRVSVPPPDVRAYYRQRPEQFRVPRSAQFRMITLHFVRYGKREGAVRAARALLDELKKKPRSFAALAKEYSHDANAAKGGLWENVTQGSMLGALDKAVFKLKPGETSGVIETGRGCHIVRIEKAAPARTVPLEEAAPHIVRAMQAARARTELAAWLRQLQATSYIEIMDK